MGGIERTIGLMAAGGVGACVVSTAQTAGWSSQRQQELSSTLVLPGLAGVFGGAKIARFRWADVFRVTAGEAIVPAKVGRIAGGGTGAALAIAGAVALGTSFGALVTYLANGAGSTGTSGNSFFDATVDFTDGSDLGPGTASTTAAEIARRHEVSSKTVVFDSNTGAWVQFTGHADDARAAAQEFADLAGK